MSQQGDTKQAGGLKTCVRCHAELPRYLFRADRSKRDGLYPRCKLCCGMGLLRVIHYRPCQHCGCYFKPRRKVRHCSRACATEAGTWRRENNPHWKGDSASYGAAHRRIREARGKPSACEHCGDQAAHWALDHGKAGLVMQSKDGPYSPEPSDYVALCVPCHKTMDLSRETRQEQLA